MVNGHGKSDSSAVPRKSPNQAEGPAREAREGRGRAKGNSPECNALRTQGRDSTTSVLERVRQAARKDRKQRFTALLHHIYDVERLRAAYLTMKKDAAAGVDGETWEHYGETLEANLQDLSHRLRRGAYRAGRSPHQALEALVVGSGTRKVNWVLDADIRKFYDTLDQGWLVRCMEHRVADRRVVRLIQKWLKAGVLEEGKRVQSEVGTVQGGSISPLLSNLYLHHVLDLWIRRWRQKQAQGEVICVRLADDFVAGFQHRHEAEPVLAELRERFVRFGLALHADKTRIVEFDR
jgi:RNA-directed DNA polymerase